MREQNNEARVILAIDAIQKTDVLSCRAAAKLYNVPETHPHRTKAGIPSRIMPMHGPIVSCRALVRKTDKSQPEQRSLPELTWLERERQRLLYGPQSPTVRES